MKSFFIAMATFMVLASSVYAAPKLDWSSEYKAIDNVGVVGGNNLSAGVYVGPIGEIKNGTKSIAGIGGFNFNVKQQNDAIRPSVSIVPLTLFDNLIFIGVNLDNLNRRNATSFIAISATGLGSTIYNRIAK